MEHSHTHGGRATAACRFGRPLSRWHSIFLNPSVPASASGTPTQVALGPLFVRNTSTQRSAGRPATGDKPARRERNHSWLPYRFANLVGGQCERGGLLDVPLPTKMRLEVKRIVW